MKKALFFDPYLDTLGGGERYFLTLASELSKLGYEVEIAWSHESDFDKAQKRFGIDFSTLKVNRFAYQSFSKKSSLLKRFQLTCKYDLIFWVSDGSLPFLFSKKNLVHFQVPFTEIGGNHLVNLIKTIFVHKFVYNSHFTRTVLEKVLPKSKGVVLYPPIDTDSFKPGKKENIILSVARFDSPSHSKRQDILIKAFAEFSKKNNKYKLVLAGGLIGDDKIISNLKDQSQGLNVEFVVNPDFEKIKSLYSQAKFFWHAAGYDIDETKNPEKVEHFGMTTVEAMSAGSIPVVIAKGGQKEIVKDKNLLVNDYLQLAHQTLSIANSISVSDKISNELMERSLDFSISNFNSKVKTLL